MASHKIRVFEFEVHERRARSLALPLEDPTGAGITFQNFLSETFTQTIGRVRTGVPPTSGLGEWSEPDSPEIGMPQIKFDNVNSLSHGSPHLLFEFGYGHNGIFEEVGDASGVVDTRKKSALKTNRVVFLFPTSGTRGIVIADVANRKSPIELLCAWFRYFSYERGDNLKLVVNQIADRNHLRRMLFEAKSVKVKLVDSAHGAAGRPRKHSTLEIAAEGEVRMSNVVDEATRWLGFDGDRNYVSTLASIVGLSVEQLREADLYFDSAKIEIVTEGGKSKTLSPDSIRDKFDYDIYPAHLRKTKDWLSATRDFYTGSSLSEGVDILW